MIFKPLLNMQSHPVWGAWIETPSTPGAWVGGRSHPVWGAWIETNWLMNFVYNETSHPVWGAWIETSDLIKRLQSLSVAPRVGCVD